MGVNTLSIRETDLIPWYRGQIKYRERNLEIRDEMTLNEKQVFKRRNSGLLVYNSIAHFLIGAGATLGLLKYLD